MARQAIALLVGTFYMHDRAYGRRAYESEQRLVMERGLLKSNAHDYRSVSKDSLSGLTIRSRRVHVGLNAAAQPVSKESCIANVNRIDKMRHQSLEAGQQDPYFPPNISSICTNPTDFIGDSAQNIEMQCTQYDKWMTFEQAAQWNTWSDRPFQVFDSNGVFENGVIYQGDAGTCYLLGAMAGLAYQHPDLISRMFVRRDLWQKNVFTTRWYIDGKESFIQVDDLIPGDLNYGPYFAKPSTTGLFWPVILEKAWAKINGNYQVAEFGFTANVLNLMTGAKVRTIEHNEISRGDLWNILVNSTQMKYPMAASTESWTGWYGTAQGHAYAVLKAYMERVDGKWAKVVKVFNPWGRNGYTGQMKDRNDNTTGAFIMTLREYKAAFWGTDIAEVHDGYKITEKKVHETMLTSSNWSYQLNVPVTGPFYVSLTAPNGRLGCPSLFEENDDGYDYSEQEHDDEHKGLQLIVQNSAGGPEAHGEYNKENGLNSITATIDQGPGNYNVQIMDPEFWSSSGELAFMTSQLRLTVYAAENVSIQEHSTEH